MTKLLSSFFQAALFEDDVEKMKEYQLVIFKKNNPR